MIKIEGLTFRYPNSESELISVNRLILRKNETTGIIGRSGVGKTTFLKLISGELSADVGLLQNQFYSTGFVFQSDGLLPWFSVEKNISLPGLIQNGNNRLEMRAAIEKIGIDDILKKHPHELSGGQKKLVEIARLLSAKADLWILDEPFTSLDLVTKKALYDLVFSIPQGQERPCVLLASHDPFEIATYCDRVIRISCGLVEEIELPDNLCLSDRQDIIEMNLDVPTSP